MQQLVFGCVSIFGRHSKAIAGKFRAFQSCVRSNIWQDFSCHVERKESVSKAGISRQGGRVGRNLGYRNELGLDISRLRESTGLVTLDEGYGNTGSCRSAISFITVNAVSFGIAVSR